MWESGVLASKNQIWSWKIPHGLSPVFPPVPLIFVGIWGQPETPPNPLQDSDSRPKNVGIGVFSLSEAKHRMWSWKIPRDFPSPCSLQHPLYLTMFSWYRVLRIWISLFQELRSWGLLPDFRDFTATISPVPSLVGS